MVLTEQQIKLIQTGYQRISADAPAFARIFYAKLFELDPDLRSLFRNDLELQGRKLVAMLELTVYGMDDMGMLHPMLVQLAERHNDYHVSQSNIDLMEQALLSALRDFYQGDFDPQEARAWQKLYHFVSETMKPHLTRE